MLSGKFFFSFLSLIFLSGALKAQTWTAIENWKYIPLDDAYWNQYENISEKKITSATLDFTFEKAKDKDINVLDDAEYYISLADSLVASGYRQAGFNIYFAIVKRHPGTFLSQKSLVGISSLIASDETLTDEYDEEELSRLINQAAFKDVPESVLGLVSYYSTVDDFSRKLNKWAQLTLKNLKKEHYWTDRIQYYYAIQLYAQNKIDQAELELKNLAEKPQLSAKLKWRVQLQRARIYFEQKKFSLAEEIYKNYKFPPRIFGKVLLERAWTQFYLKEYSTALGLLESLKAPTFNFASDPEQYILAMVIYRELCHYPKVVKLAEEFQNKFKSTYNLIVSNKPLKDNLVLVWQTIFKPGYREPSDVIDSIFKERELLSKVISQKDTSVAAQLIYGQYQSRKVDLEKRLERFMKKDISDQANQFLGTWDQIKLAEYISKLDEFRIKPMFENRRYVANTEELKSFNKLFWPVTGEYWRDEFENYQVILSDRCDGGSGVKGANRE